MIKEIYERVAISWKKIYIWDVLDHLKLKADDLYDYENEYSDNIVNSIYWKLFDNWKKKREILENQNDTLIRIVYELIKKN